MTKKTIKPHPTELAVKVADSLTKLHEIGYAKLSPDLIIEQTSENFERYLTIRNIEKIEGLHLTEVLWEFIGAENIFASLLIGKEQVYHLDYINRETKDGSANYLNFTIQLLDKDLPEDGFLLIIEDVTQIGRLEHKLAQERNELRLTRAQLAQANEQLTNLNRLKSLFLSIVAHDMRSPLSAALGYTQIVQEDLRSNTLGTNNLSTATSYDMLSIVVSQIKWLDRLITDLLDLDQFEQGKLTINPEYCNLNKLIHKVIQALADTVSLQGKSLTADLPDKEIIVFADPDRVLQILYNIIGNAIKYTFEGGLIKVSAWVDRNYGGFQVKDSGIGISEEEQAQLFRIYYRTEGAQQSTVKGTGLGLFIVKTLVDAHQGAIEVSSYPNIGTTIKVSLPKKPPEFSTTGA